MANAINLERFRRQLSACLGRNVTRPKPIPLTGIEKHFLEEPEPVKSEAEIARDFWSELNESFKKDQL